MIKRLAIISLAASALALAPLGSASAQVMVGAEGGVNFASFVMSLNNFSGSTDVTPKTMISARALVDINLGEALFLRTGIGYIQRGGAIKVTSTYYGYSYTSEGVINIQYLDIPVLVKYALSSSALQPYFFAGPSLGYFLSGTSESTAGGKTEKYNIMRDEVQNLNFGIEAGGGISIPLSPKAVFMTNVSYTLGLTNVVAGEAARLGGNLKTRDIRVQVGVMFGF